MNIVYHGHSCVELKGTSHSIIIDPFIRGNPQSTISKEEIKVDYILLTHGHDDHTADALDIALQNDATIVATHELASYFSNKGAKTISMNIGGSCALPFGKVKMTQAFHSSSITNEEGNLVYTGMPAGFIIEMENTTFYHAGDTNLFLDMKLIGERNNIQIAFLPIGDTFTMGIEDASVAAEWLKAKLVIPVHFNTFPPIEEDPYKFIELLTNKGVKGKVLSIGEDFSI